jgi:hypothetical protein
MLTRGRRRPSPPKPQPPSRRGKVAGFKSERWRLQIGIVAGFKSEKVAAFSWNLQPDEAGASGDVATPGTCPETAKTAKIEEINLPGD